MAQVTLNMTIEQLGLLDRVAAQKNLNREEAVRMMLEHMALLDEVGPDAYASIMRGKADAEAGRFVPDEEMESIFSHFRYPK